jgi:hypothetical protein
VAQVVEHQTSKYEALSPNANTEGERDRERERERERERLI